MHPFVKDREDFDRLGARTVEMLGEFLRSLPAQPVDRVVPDAVRRRLMSPPLPDQGMSPDDVFELTYGNRALKTWATPRSMH